MRLNTNYNATDNTTLVDVWDYTADNVCGIDPTDDSQFAMLASTTIRDGIDCTVDHFGCWLR
jgi:hypothetical protein